MAQEEYPSEDSEEETEPTTEVAALAIASTFSVSLFESPNENLSTNNASCFMAHISEDYASGGSKWVVDSGYTSHMTGSKEIMTELRQWPKQPPQ